jgi:hypothetical protein
VILGADFLDDTHTFVFGLFNAVVRILEVVVKNRGFEEAHATFSTKETSLSSGQSPSGQNLSGQNLSGQNLSGQNLSGQYRRFGEFGPAYEVVRLASATHAAIRVVSSGEELDYSLERLHQDPIAITIP